MLTGVCVQRRRIERAIPTPARVRSAVHDLAPAAMLLLAGLIGLFIASLSGSGRNGQYLVITAPWSSLGTTIDLIGSAEGGLIETGRFQNIAIAHSSHADFAERAREAGAWLVSPAPRIAGCIGIQTEISRR